MQLAFQNLSKIIKRNLNLKSIMCKTSSFHTNKSVLPCSFSDISSDASPHDTATGDQMKPTVLLSKSQNSLGLNTEHNCLYLFMHFGVWDNIHLEAAWSVSFTPPSSHFELLYTFIYISVQNQIFNFQWVVIQGGNYPLFSFLINLLILWSINESFSLLKKDSLVSLVKSMSQNPKTLELPFSVGTNNNKSLHVRCWKQHEIYIFCLKNGRNMFFQWWFMFIKLTKRSVKQESAYCGSATL